MKNKISVIMSLYKNDTPEYATAAIESLLSQDVYCDVLIYRDGKVSDALQAVLDGYSENTRCKIFEFDDNKGLATALNYLIERCLEGATSLLLVWIVTIFHILIDSLNK
ncbi:glycosyltransferase [Buttiauxella agrestis]